MVMDDPEAVREFDEAGLSLLVPVHDVCSRAISRLLPDGGTMLDLGCGSARLVERIARGRPDANIIGLDLSEAMLDTGRRRLAREGLADRVELRRADITTFDGEVAEEPDLITCNFALHQLPSEDVVRRCFGAIARVRERSGCGVWIFDFARLRHPRSWPAVMSMLRSPGPVVEEDSLASERAAYTLDEVTSLLDQAGLGDLEHVRSRPLGEYQVHWALGRRDARPPGSWHDVPLPPGTRMASWAVRRSFPRALIRQ
jgi:ubiquinone/menaquinone biosynthesis C-methylase UbiE